MRSRNDALCTITGLGGNEDARKLKLNEERLQRQVGQQTRKSAPEKSQLEARVSLLETKNTELSAQTKKLEIQVETLLKLLTRCLNPDPSLQQQLAHRQPETSEADLSYQQNLRTKQVVSDRLRSSQQAERFYSSSR